MKLVMATVSEVRVGEVKPRREKIVAEKYMREFWASISTSLRDIETYCPDSDGAYKTTQLLQPLEQARDR